MEKEAWECVSVARRYASKESYSKAYDMYMDAFVHYPPLKSDLEDEFCAIVLRLNKILFDRRKPKTIYMHLARAVAHFPNNKHIRNDFGKYSYQYGLYKSARDHLEAALKIDPTFVSPEKSLNSLKNLLVKRWHYRMLNDNIRNETYRRAIQETIKSPEDRVLDIGTGTGLLAIYASKARANTIVGCDGSDVMCEMAKRIASQNMVNNFKIINKMSLDIELSETDEKYNVLLTELFDAGLFGEHVLQTLSHAWEHLLTATARVVPGSAEFFVIGAECDYLNKKYQLCSVAKQLLNIPELHVHMTTQDETYDSEDVHMVKDLTYLTKSQSVFKINFNNAEDISNMLNRTEPFKVDLKPTKSGVMNTLIGWFNLYLSETETITTNPQASDRANAWQQAVFYDYLPKKVEENEIITINFLINGGQITLDEDANTHVERASMEIVRFLNDQEYIKTITATLDPACAYLEQSTEMSQISIADFCPFPYFGLQMLKRGAQSLLCWARTDEDRQFLVNVLRANNISMSKVTIIFGMDWTSDIFREEKFHIVFNHTLELCGEIDIHMKEIGEHLKQSRLHPGGLYMPAQIHTVAQLVSSHWLDLNNKIHNENVSGLFMAYEVNKYSVTQNFHIDLHTLKHVPITRPCTMHYVDEDHNWETVSTITEGHGNALLCWYNIQLMEGSEEISTNRPDSFIDGILFLTYVRTLLRCDTEVRIVEHRDEDGSFKLRLVLSTEAPSEK